MAGVLAARSGELYQRTLSATNATAPVWQTVHVRRDTGSPSFNRYFWFPKAEFVPIHDEDGNLLDDGRWLYTWNAENRLIQMETTTTAGHGPPVNGVGPRKLTKYEKCDFAGTDSIRYYMTFDDMGAVRKIVGSQCNLNNKPK